MVSMLDSIVVERGFQPRFGQTKDYKIAICCISAKHAALRSKSKTGWLRIRMFEWSIRSTRGLLLHWVRHYKSQTKHIGLVQRVHHHYWSSTTCTSSLLVEYNVYIITIGLVQHGYHHYWSSTTCTSSLFV